MGRLPTTPAAACNETSKGTPLPDKIAIAVDTQMDDGANTTGQVRGLLQAGPNPAVAAPAGAYAETGTNQYLLCKNL